jgi:oligopeptide/dipeptide ABC transporter ATP-binding protein
MAFLDIQNLHLSMRSYAGEAHVLNGINLSVDRGEIWGLVGESGCGKSLTGLSISRLIGTPPARYSAGSIRLGEHDVLQASESTMRGLRGRRVGMIFQDPTTNLNPAFRVGTQLADVALHAAAQDPSILEMPAGSNADQRRKAARLLSIKMLDLVGIPDAAQRVDDYPHQFSGGMRQRVLIAMALIGRPELLIADEPTTALDVSVQTQILALIHRLVQEHNLAVVFITHNLGVVAQLCTHVAVMYAGNIVESGNVREVFHRPGHPYTRALLASLPTRDLRRGELAALPGSVPDLLKPPPGCRLAPRCPQAVGDCTKAFPAVREVAAGHTVACIFANETRSEGAHA